MLSRALPTDTSSDLTASVTGTLTAVVGGATVEEVVLEAAAVELDVPGVADVPEHAARARAPASTPPTTHRRPLIRRSRHRRCIPQRRRAYTPVPWLVARDATGSDRPTRAFPGAPVNAAHPDRPTTGA